MFCYRYLYEQCGCVNVRPPLQHPSVPNYRSCSLQEWADCGLKAYTDWSKLSCTALQYCFSLLRCKIQQSSKLLFRNRCDLMSDGFKSQRNSILLTNSGLTSSLSESLHGPQLHRRQLLLPKCLPRDPIREQGMFLYRLLIPWLLIPWLLFVYYDQIW